MFKLLVLGLATGLLSTPTLQEPESEAKLKCQSDPNCYWWLGQDSPFKKASQRYDQKTPIEQPRGGNYNANPFLNGQFGAAKPTQPPASEPNYGHNPFLSQMFAANGSRVEPASGFLGVQPFGFAEPRPFAQQDGARRCAYAGQICVARDRCRNGVLVDYASKTVKDDNEECDMRDHVCCSFPNEIDRSGYDHQKIDVRLAPVPQGPSNLSFLTQEDSKVPGPLFKVTGGAGLSPAVIQVLPVEINNAGEFGQSHQGESTSKPAREIPIRSFGGFSGTTPDYSNVNFDDAIRFASTIRGPAYLPPKGQPTPGNPSIPDLEAPISTYQPKVPTTSRPFPNVITSQTVNNQFISQQPQKPTDNGYLPPSPPKPFVTASTTARPISRPSSPFPSYPSTQKPYTPQYRPQPTTNLEYLPPSTSNVNNQYRPFPSSTTQKPYYTQSVVTQKPRPPPTFIPSSTDRNQYVSQTYRPSSYRPVVTSTSRVPTPGYQYPSPTTPKPVYRPSISTSGYTYSKQTQSGYQYPTPTPAFTFPTQRPTTTEKILQPSPSYNVPSSYKPGYDYPKPSPSPTNQFTIKITTPGPNPTKGYEYPKPTPQFPFPTQGITGSPSNVQSSIRPFPTTQQNIYLPPATSPRPTGGYTYPKPTPSFNLDGQAASNSNQYIPPTRKPEPDRVGSDTSDNGVKVRPYPEPDQSANREVVVPPAGCAAALKCVQEIYCTADGFVSPVPVVLSKEEAENKVPTTTCRDISSGTDGVCCRDPNYKDPWPSANLVNGIDDGQYREDDSIGQYKFNSIDQRVTRSNRPSRSFATTGAEDNDNLKRNNEGNCGIRNYNTQPKGPTPLNMNFAEIPWQAMILRESNRSLLCGGAIIKKNAVLTTASCVEGLPTSDILIKGGEWKLGIDEEPLPFQIVKTAAILPHPSYTKGSKVNDLAIVFLEEKLRLAKNIGTICLPEPNQIPTRNCITTGWGKRILQLHAKGAIMRAIKTHIMDNGQCGDVLKTQYPESYPYYSPNTLCGFSANDQCKVDYGSALACSNGNDQYVLSGIFSWDTGCKDENQIGGYIAPDVEWINSMLEKPLKELRRLDKQIRS